MVGITQEKQFISFISIVVPKCRNEQYSHINVSKISRNQLISTLQTVKATALRGKFPIKEKKTWQQKQIKQ